MNEKYARFVIPFDNKVILGHQFNDMFESQTVYEIIDFYGELIIRKVGKSMISEDSLQYRDVNTIVTNGNHLLTIEEYEKKKRLQENVI